MPFKIKHIFFAIAIIVISYIVFSSLNKTTIKNQNSNGTTIVAFGDSLVQGVGSTYGNDLFSILSERIDQRIINLGVSGNTTSDARARLQTVLDQDPRLVIILLGGNDYLKKIPIETTFENLRYTVQKIQEQGSAVLILGVRGGLIKDTYNARFEDFANQNQTGFVPNVLVGLLGDSRYMSDAIHPNDAGYKKIADKIEPILKDVLNIK